jgi:hypothetical protein
MFPSIALFATASLYFFALADAAPSKRQSDNGACAQLAATCASEVNNSLSNVFSIGACVFAATCFGGQHQVDDFLATLFANKNGGANAGTPPQSVNLPRVPSSVRPISFNSSQGCLYIITIQLLNTLSDDGKTITQQHFIDGVYGYHMFTHNFNLLSNCHLHSQLSVSNGPYPSSADIVIGWYNRVSTWCVRPFLGALVFANA